MKKEQNKLVSNGIYSVMKDEWIKEPVKEDIPEIDQEALDKSVKVWEDRYNEIIKAGEKKLDESLHEDLNDAKSIIADQIRGEWEAIQNYNKAIDDLSNINGNFSEIIDILNSISDEEEIHVGELEKAQSLMDANVLDNIEDGRNEAGEDIAKDFPLDEALSWSDQKKKMDAWHNGTRGANIASMSDDKLEMNARICDQAGYTYELQQLENEATRRGIQLSTMKFRKPQLEFNLYSLTDDDIKLGIKENENDPIEVINDCAGASKKLTILNLAELLLPAVVMGCKEVATVIKDELINEYGYTLDEIKEYLARYSKDTKLMQELSEKINKALNESLTEELETPQLDQIEKYIDDIYELRKEGLTTGGEYSIENLTFKEIRNKGYLDDLKDLKNELIGKELSLESLEGTIEQDLADNRMPIDVDEEEIFDEPFDYKKEIAKEKGLEEDMSEEKLEEIKDKITILAGQKVLFKGNGLFTIKNVSQTDIEKLMLRLGTDPDIEWIQKDGGVMDPVKMINGWLPERWYTVNGQIKNVK